MNRLKRLGFTPGVLAAFFSIVAVFAVLTVADDHSTVPKSVHLPVVAALGLPPAMFAVALGILSSTLSQTFVDIVFLPAAAAYWLLLAFAADRLYVILRKALHDTKRVKG